MVVRLSRYVDLSYNYFIVPLSLFSNMKGLHDLNLSWNKHVSGTLMRERERERERGRERGRQRGREREREVYCDTEMKSNHHVHMCMLDLL